MRMPRLIWKRLIAIYLTCACLVEEEVEDVLIDRKGAGKAVLGACGYVGGKADKGVAEQGAVSR